MLFERPLIEGRLLRRYKRFLADIELPGGQVIVAHCANPGSMATCAPERARVWLSVHDNPARKLPYTWELVEAHGALVCVNTARANHVVAEGIARGVVVELAGYREMRREVAWGARTRIDFMLAQPQARRAGPPCLVEVKSATMWGGDRVAVFPDAVTARGTRHLEELMRAASQGFRAVLLFCCNRSDSRVVRPADHIDPTYGRTLRRAARAGVEILAYRSDMGPGGIELAERIAVELPAIEPGAAAAPIVKRGAKKTVRLVPLPRAATRAPSRRRGAWRSSGR